MVVLGRQQLTEYRRTLRDETGPKDVPPDIFRACLFAFLGDDPALAVPFLRAGEAEHAAGDPAGGHQHPADDDQQQYERDHPSDEDGDAESRPAGVHAAKTGDEQAEQNGQPGGLGRDLHRRLPARRRVLLRVGLLIRGGRVLLHLGGLLLRLE